MIPSVPLAAFAAQGRNHWNVSINCRQVSRAKAIAGRMRQQNVPSRRTTLHVTFCVPRYVGFKGLVFGRNRFSWLPFVKELKIRQTELENLDFYNFGLIRAFSPGSLRKEKSEKWGSNFEWTILWWKTSRRRQSAEESHHWDCRRKYQAVWWAWLAGVQQDLSRWQILIQQVQKRRWWFPITKTAAWQHGCMGSLRFYGERAVEYFCQLLFMIITNGLMYASTDTYSRKDSGYQWDRKAAPLSGDGSTADAGMSLSSHQFRASLQPRVVRYETRCFPLSGHGKTGQEILRKLVGYSVLRETMEFGVGHFGWGDIIDIYPLEELNPPDSGELGDEIETLKKSSRLQWDYQVFEIMFAWSIHHYCYILKIWSRHWPRSIEELWLSVYSGFGMEGEKLLEAQHTRREPRYDLPNAERKSSIFPQGIENLKEHLNGLTPRFDSIHWYSSHETISVICGWVPCYACPQLLEQYAGRSRSHKSSLVSRFHTAQHLITVTAVRRVQ